jgi:hypothetical protein
MGVPSPGHYFKGVATLPMTPSYEKTASALIYTGKCLIGGIIINSDGTNNATLTIYDNTEGTGNVLCTLVCKGDELNMGVMFNNAPRIMSNGIYATLSVAGGGTAKYYIDYFTGPVTGAPQTWGTF